jgi:branched-chain amino acid transport system permease protein
MVVVGGMHSITGAYMGVFFILGVEEIGMILAPKMAELFPKLGGTIIGAIPVIFVGVVLILFILFEPRGLVHRWEIIKTSIRLFPFSH